MEKFNSFSIAGFIVKDADVKQFTKATKASFGISIAHADKDNKNRVSAIQNVEFWQSNEDTSKFDLLKKGNRVMAEGYFKPEEYTDSEGKHRNNIKFVVKTIAPYVSEKDETPAE